MRRLVIAIAAGILSTLALQGATAAEVGATVVFTDGEIRLISAWYREHGSMENKHQGKGKRNGLPPGISKNLARGKPLPPGIAKQALPYELRRALPSVMDGHERVIVDGRVLLIETATQIVRDVLSDIILD